MSADWPVIKLSQLTSKITKGTTPNQNDGGFSDSGINYIKAEAVGFDGRIDTSKFSYISEDVHNKLKRSQLEVDDILFSMAGIHLGKVGIVEEKHVPANTNQALALIRPIKELIEPKYLFYFLQKREINHFVNNATSQSAQPNINLEQIGNLDIEVPSLKTQKSIVKILEILDRKIDINTQTNQTLESIAQAIFKSWFVDFEPVKAKMAALAEGGSREQAELAAMGAISGKSEAELAQLQQQNPEHYQQLAETAALFPNAMVESELGEIPEGWEVFELNCLANLNEKSWTTKNAPAQISYVGLANTKWGVINSIESYEYNDAPSRARRILRKNDTIIGTVRPGNGSFSFIKTDNLTGSTGFAVLSPKQEVFSELNYIAATSPENIERLAHLADGGAYPAVRPEIVMETCVTLPALDEIRLKISSVFHTYTSSFFDAINENQVENTLLAELRDSLLPKLLSGEIDLSDIQSEVA